MTAQSHLLTSKTVEEGDVLYLGAGTSDYRASRVVKAEKVVQTWNGFRVTADLTFEDGSFLRVYDGTILHRAVFTYDVVDGKVVVHDHHNQPSERITK